MAPWLDAVLGVALVSSISLIGLVTIRASEQALKRAMPVIIAIAVGALLGDAFVHLLPEAYAKLGFSPSVSAVALGGLATFYLLEIVVRTIQSRAGPGDGEIKPVGPLALAADALHNSVDGLIVTTSFLTDVRLGVATLVAVVLHEIPHEFGNFGILLHAGYAWKKAVWFNFLAGLAAMAGVGVAFLFGMNASLFAAWTLPFSAGAFVYLACCNLLPSLLKSDGAGYRAQDFIGVAAGVALMFAMLRIG